MLLNGPPFVTVPNGVDPATIVSLLLATIRDIQSGSLTASELAEAMETLAKYGAEQWLETIEYKGGTWYVEGEGYVDSDGKASD